MKFSRTELQITEPRRIWVGNVGFFSDPAQPLVIVITLFIGILPCILCPSQTKDETQISKTRDLTGILYSCFFSEFYSC